MIAPLLSFGGVASWLLSFGGDDNVVVLIFWLQDGRMMIYATDNVAVVRCPIVCINVVVGWRP